MSSTKGSNLVSVTFFFMITLFHVFDQVGNDSSMSVSNSIQGKLSCGVQFIDVHRRECMDCKASFN